MRSSLSRRDFCVFRGCRRHRVVGGVRTGCSRGGGASAPAQEKVVVRYAGLEGMGQVARDFWHLGLKSRASVARVNTWATAHPASTAPS